MDIEGSEYEMLLHWYKNDILDLIDKLALEKHPNMNPLKDIDFFDYIIKKSGIQKLKWV